MEQLAISDTSVLTDELITYYTDVINLLNSINDTLLFLIIVIGFSFGTWMIYSVLKSIMG